jgi:hypothetical protein
MKSINIFFILVPLMFICSIFYGQDSNQTGPMYAWNLAGSHPQNYEIGKDENILYNEKPAYYLKSVREADKGFGTIMKYIQQGEYLDKYLGKRVRLTGIIKSDNIDNHAGMWMRVDGPDPDKSLQFDNMGNRPITGTNDWTKYEIVLDIPENSTGIGYGVLISGSGQVWLGNLSIDVVGDDVPSTNMDKKE